MLSEYRFCKFCPIIVFIVLNRMSVEAYMQDLKKRLFCHLLHLHHI